MENENKFEIIILENGPYQVKGNFSFKDSSGKISTGQSELFLCRCGGSQNKPYCDDSHKKTGVKN